MASTQFAASTEAHNNLSQLVRLVKEQDMLVFITHHGKPRYAITPIDPDEIRAENTSGIRDLAKDFTQTLKRLQAVGELTITSRGQPVAQLIAIEPDEVDDMIVAHTLNLQGLAAKVQDPAIVDQLPSADSLLKKLHALRNKVSA